MYLEPYQVVRELISGSVAVVNVYLFFAFAARASGWRKNPASQAALVLSIYFLGALILRMWDWLLIKLNNLNAEFDYPAAEYLLWLVKQSWLIAVIFGAILIFGGLGAVWVFSPRERRVGRLICVAAVSIFVPFLTYVGFHGWPH